MCFLVKLEVNMEINVNQSGGINYNPISDNVAKKLEDELKMVEEELKNFLDEEMKKIMDDPNLSIEEKAEKANSLKPEYGKKGAELYDNLIKKVEENRLNMTPDEFKEVLIKVFNERGKFIESLSPRSNPLDGILKDIEKKTGREPKMFGM